MGGPRGRSFVADVKMPRCNSNRSASTMEDRMHLPLNFGLIPKELAYVLNV